MCLFEEAICVLFVVEVPASYHRLTVPLSFFLFCFDSLAWKPVSQSLSVICVK